MPHQRKNRLPPLPTLSLNPFLFFLRADLFKPPQATTAKEENLDRSRKRRGKRDGGRTFAECLPAEEVFFAVSDAK